MAENEGLHIQLTADASSYISTINNAKNKLAELAAEVKILKQGERDIQTALAESKKRYGETSTQVDRLTADLLDNAKEQEKLKQEIKEVNATLDTATKEYKEYGNSAKQSFDSASQQSQKTAETLKSGFNMVKGLIVGYAGKKLYEVLIGSNADYEQSLTSFEVLLQSADKADVMMQKLEKMGASTPFELSDLTGATEQLLAFGVAEQDVETKLQQLGDLAMGNADKFERLTSAYGKMLAKGKVSLEELNMFTEAGVPILEELQNQYGVTGEEMFSMISNGKVGVEEINSAMESMTGAGGKFFGMMEKQSKTLDGMLSTMSDNVTMFGRLVGEETFEILKNELEGLLATINEMSESGELQEIAHDLGQAIATAVTFIMNLVKWLYEMRGVLIVGAGAIGIYKTAMAGLSIFNSVSGWIQGWNIVLSTSNNLTETSTLLKNLHKAAVLKDAAAIKACSAAGLADVTVKGSQIVATNTATGATVSFNAALAANPIGAVITLVLGLVTALLTLTRVLGGVSEETDEFAKRMQEIEDSHKQAMKSIDDTLATEVAETTQVEVLTEKIIKLGNEYNNCTEDTEEARKKEEEFRTVAKQLAEYIPEITDALFDETGQIRVQAEEVENLKRKYIELAKAKAFAKAAEEEMNQIAATIVNYEIEAEKAFAGYKEAEAAKVNPAEQALKDGKIDALWQYYTETENGIGFQTRQGYERAANMINDPLEIAAQEYTEQWNLINNEKIPELQKELEIVEETYGKYIVDEAQASKNATTGETSTTSTSTKGKTTAELAAEAFKKSYESDLDFIEDRNFYDDWGRFKVQSTDENGNIVEMAASEIKAYEDLLEKLRAAYDEGIIDYDYYSQKTRDISKKLYTAEKNAYKERLANSEEYIKQRELLDDWGEDSKIDAIQRMMDYTDEAYKDGILSWDEYCEEIGDLSTDLYSEIQNMVEEEKKRVEEQLEEEFETKKQYMEDELAFRKQMYDKEISYLDELKAKREEEKEDEDYAERMARLQAKLEYEMDDDNRLALQKEIAELQEEMDDTEFDREIERKKSVLENAKTYAEEKTQDDLTRLTSYYEDAMSDMNIAETVYKNLDFDKFKEMGDIMGQNLAAGISGALNPVISAINKLITLGSNVQSPANNTVTTTDNSISVTQYNNGVSNVPTAAETKKAVDDYMFLNGRLG